jgi:hypothetical protein
LFGIFWVGEDLPAADKPHRGSVKSVAVSRVGESASSNFREPGRTADKSRACLPGRMSAKDSAAAHQSSKSEQAVTPRLADTRQQLPGLSRARIH